MDGLKSLPDRKVRDDFDVEATQIVGRAKSDRMRIAALPERPGRKDHFAGVVARSVDANDAGRAPPSDHTRSTSTRPRIVRVGRRHLVGR